VRAVNLIPADAERGGGKISLKLAPATYALLGVLAAALVLVTMYVLANNQVASKKATLATLQSELTQAQAEASHLSAYAQFASLAQTRVQTVRGIAATRFNWSTALGNLARVVPHNASLQSLSGTVVPGANVGGGGGGSSLRADLQGPAFELMGCTSTQVDVARLISRLRAMPDVMRVALGSSNKSDNQQAGVSTSGSGGGGCKRHSASFDLVVFYNPVNGAGPTGAISLGSTATPSTTSTGGAK
jgi:Tfp pilus assembly protein PilN